MRQMQPETLPKNSNFFSCLQNNMRQVQPETRAPDNFQVQRVITPYFWKWWVFAYFLCTVVLSTSEKIAYMYTFKIMLDTSVIQ
jgi:hypothetical protein